MRLGLAARTVGVVSGNGRAAGAVLSWAVPAVALLMATVMLVPANVWHHPANDAEYTGFDQNLLFSDPSGGGTAAGIVTISRESLTLTALPNSQPTVQLLISPLAFSAAMDLRVLESSEGATPFRIGVWNPVTTYGFEVNFGPAPDNLISVQTLANRSPIVTRVLGTYMPGHTYRLELAYNKTAYIITGRLSPLASAGEGDQVQPTPPDPSNTSAPQPLLHGTEFSVDANQLPALFSFLRRYLAVSASGMAGMSRSSLDHYSVRLPSQRWVALKVDDARVRYLTYGLIGLGGALCIIGLTSWAARFRVRLNRPPRSLITAWLDRPLSVRHPALVATAAIAGCCYLILNAVLFGAGTVPFDGISQQVWSYIASRYSMFELYYRTFTATNLAGIWRGIPYNEPGYPYGIATAYYYATIGWLHQLFLTPAGLPSSGWFTLEFLIKTFNVSFCIADAGLIYIILCRWAVVQRHALLSVGLFLFNFAVIFGMSIWGQIETVVIFPVLLSLWLADVDRPLLAWLLLSIAALSKPQVVLIAFFIGIIYIRKFSIKHNIQSASWSVIFVFLVASPFSLAISPSLSVDIMGKLFDIWGRGAVDPSVTSVGGGSYSVWPLATWIISGQSGLHRLSYSRFNHLIYSLSYSNMSNIMVVAVLVIAVMCVLRGGRWRAGSDYYVVVVAFGLLGFMMFQTGVVSRYFLYCLPLVLLCRKAMGSRVYYACVIALTITIFVSMYGEFAFANSGTPWATPILHESNNVITQFFMNLYASDWFITGASGANLLVLAWLGWCALRGDAESVK